MIKSTEELFIGRLRNNGEKFINEPIYYMYTDEQHLRVEVEESEDGNRYYAIANRGTSEEHAIEFVEIAEGRWEVIKHTGAMPVQGRLFVEQ